MSTQLRSDTARANGAKSQGPKTAEGRARSSRNAVKHGLSSRNPLILECENDDDFDAVRSSQMEIHQPATPAEKDLVDQMVAARWRILRLQSIESDILNTEMRKKQESEEKFPSGRIIKLSDAYTTEVNDSRAMALASGCESRLNRTYQSYYKILRELQAARMKQTTQPAVPESTQPEPPSPPLPIAAEAAERICRIKPSAAFVSNTSNASSTPGGAGDSPARSRERHASL